MDNNKLTSTGTLTPVLEKEEQTSSNTHSMYHIWLREKLGFWQNLFGERKCKHCSLKKAECKCKRKSNKSNILSDIELKSTSTQTGLQCRSILPSANRGCGVHVHVCMKPKLKKDHLKSSSGLRCSNLGLKMDSESNSLRHCTKCTPCAECNKVPERLFPKDTTGSWLKPPLDKIVSNTYLQTQNGFTDNLIHEENKSIFPTLNTENIVFHANHVIIPNKKEVSDREEILTKGLLEEITQIKNQSFCKNYPTINELGCESFIRKQSQILDNCAEKKLQKPEDLSKIRTSILRKPTIDKEHIENLLLPPIPFGKESSIKDTFHTSVEEKGMNDIAKSQEKIGLENKKDTNKISPIRGTCVKNSLISLRRDKHNSILEEKISIILMKLSSIEDKILDLEKENICGTNEEITISCNPRKSTVSIEFGKQEKPKSKETNSGLAAVTLIRPKEKINNTIKVESNRENVYIDTNSTISTTKPSKRKPMIMNTNQIVCSMFNPYELDAHSLTSNSYLNSNISQSKNPRVVIQCSTKDQKHTFCDKWRKISEELKISDSDLTNKVE